MKYFQCRVYPRSHRFVQCRFRTLSAEIIYQINAKAAKLPKSDRRQAELQSVESGRNGDFGGDFGHGFGAIR